MSGCPGYPEPGTKGVLYLEEVLMMNDKQRSLHYAGMEVAMGGVSCMAMVHKYCL